MTKRGKTYNTLVRTYNRLRGDNVQKITCECGKLLYESQLERHLQTKMHKQLMEYKEAHTQFLIQEREKKLKRKETIKELLIQNEQERIKLLEEQNILLNDESLN